jgi:hypothetical protein
LNLWRIEKLLIGAVALHSLLLGAMMLFFPTWALAMVSWEFSESHFFPSQSGIFLIVLSGAYAAALWYRPFAWYLVATKTVAVLFLVGEYLIGQAPSTILLAALGDGLMGAAVAAVLICQLRAKGEGQSQASGSA